MNIHEYQAKEVLRKFGVATLKGKVVTTAEEAVAVEQTAGSDAAASQPASPQPPADAPDPRHLPGDTP